MSTDTARTRVQSVDRPPWWREVLLLLGLLAAGVALAGLWRLLDPHTAHLGDTNEVQAASDGTLLLLGPIAGLLSAGFVLLRPGRMPLTRTVVAIVGSALGALVTWKVGNLLAEPHLSAVAATFIWPLSTALFLFLGAMLPVTSARLESISHPGFRGSHLDDQWFSEPSLNHQPPAQRSDAPAAFAPAELVNRRDSDSNSDLNSDRPATDQYRPAPDSLDPDRPDLPPLPDASDAGKRDRP